MKKLFKIVLYSGLILLFQSCYYDTVIEEEVIPPPDDVSYSNDISHFGTRIVFLAIKDLFHLISEMRIHGMNL